MVIFCRKVEGRNISLISPRPPNHAPSSLFFFSSRFRRGVKVAAAQFKDFGRCQEGTEAYVESVTKKLEAEAEAEAPAGASGEVPFGWRSILTEETSAEVEAMSIDDQELLWKTISTTEPVVDVVGGSKKIDGLRTAIDLFTTVKLVDESLMKEVTLSSGGASAYPYAIISDYISSSSRGGLSMNVLSIYEGCLTRLAEAKGKGKVVSFDDFANVVIGKFIASGAIAVEDD